MALWPEKEPRKVPDRPNVLVDGQIGYAKPDWSDVTKPWTFHPVSEKGEWGRHAIGSGDVNGDGAD